MNSLKVKFTNIPLSLEIDLMRGFLFQNDWGWGKYIIKKHPKIKDIYSLKNKKDQIGFLREYIIKFRKNNFQKIEKNKTKYQAEWQKIEKDFFEKLSEITGIDWPKNRKVITAMFSVNPICPRFLDDWSFSISFGYKNPTDAMEVAMHECCHFLYFERWKKMYPKMSHRKFEAPHIEWHLSEIVAPIVLNDRRIQNILKQKAAFYSEHRKIKIGNKTAPKYFSDLYKKYAKEEDGFAIFLKNAYKVIRSNKRIFDF